MSAATKCGFQRTDGTTCRATAQSSSAFCFFHDPDKARERAEARKKGGRRKKSATVLPLLGADGQPLVDVPLASVADVVKALASTFNQVRKGDVDPKTGNCLGLLAGQLLKALQESELANEIEELTNEVREIKRGNGNAPQTCTETPGGSAGDPADRIAGHVPSAG